METEPHAAPEGVKVELIGEVELILVITPVVVEAMAVSDGVFVLDALVNELTEESLIMRKLVVEDPVLDEMAAVLDVGVAVVGELLVKPQE